MSLEILERALDEHSNAIKSFVTELRSTAGAMKETLDDYGRRIDHIEAKRNRKGDGPDGFASESLGAAFVKAAKNNGTLQRWANGEKLTAKMATGIELKALVNQNANGTGYPTHEQRLPGIVHTPNLALRLLNLIPVVSVNSDLVDWVSEGVFVNSAAAQYEASPERREAVRKAESAITFTKTETRIETIAHFTKASKQVLSDNSQLESYVNDRLTYGLLRVVEDQILSGSGTGGELNGLLTQIGAYAGGYDTGSTVPDRISRALADLDNRGFGPTAIIMSPYQWHRVRTLKNSQNNYLLGSFGGMPTPTVFGVPVVPVQDMTDSQILIGDFQRGCALLQRESLAVQTGWENDDMTKNLVTILCEARVGFQLRQSAAFLRVDV